ncbi:MAG TPA: hypothetical protein DEO70_00740 [Bacteroidales bacterium]|nr:MAG: hypothetical protein A2X11_04755 [Bacteroidetes bacterium GWE2_42_24]OFY30767.1 MAG: hypothetical protein A2X09_16850 [Bacteroidetes bacterium GWF2_43_11]HBZ65335.1 hypothetical protein [Bacteroidales bacterium]
MKKITQLLFGFLLLTVAPNVIATNLCTQGVRDVVKGSQWGAADASSVSPTSYFLTATGANSSSTGKPSDTTASYSPKMPGEGLEFVLHTTEDNTVIELPLYGDVNCWVQITKDWAYISMEPYSTPGDIPITLETAGNYTIIISGILTQFGKGDTAWIGSEFLTQVNNFSDIGLTSLSGAFAHSQIASVPTTLPSTITDLSYAFDSVQSYSITNIDQWDVSHVTNMAFMFNQCTFFNEDISNWNVGMVTNMESMFSYTNGFNQNIGSWDVSQVLNMKKMFSNTYNFNQNLNNWDVGNVTTMEQMFSRSYGFNQDIGNWDVSHVTNMSNMFESSEFNHDIHLWNVSNVTNMSYMFGWASYFNQDLSTWVVSSVTDMSGMFRYANSFNQALGNWNVSNVTNMSNMFDQATAFNQDIRNWNVSNVTDMSNMFNQTTAFDQAIGNWNVSNVTNMSNMFNQATAFDQDISNWNTSHVTNMSGMFSAANAFNHSIGNWVVSAVVNMSNMFNNNTTFNQDISNWDISHVTNMAGMFKKATAFNQNIGLWDVSNLSSMSEMFREAPLFNQNIGTWNVSNVTDMNSMFYQATAFNQNIGNWDVSKATNMSSMFYQATAFNQNIGNWDVSKVTNMSSMFYQATAFNQNIGNWDVSKVTNMGSMFYQATGFDQNLGAWDVSIVFIMTNMFSGVTLSTANYDALLTGWSARTLRSNVNFNAGSSKYSQSAASSRAILTGTYNWTITDGGTANVFTWDGSESTDWNTAGNWDQNAVPTINDEVTIGNNGYAPIISSSTPANCMSLSVNADASLTINSGGSLITNSATGAVIVKRTQSGTGQYHFLSSPINNADLANIFPENNQEDIYLRQYNETTGTWENIEIPATLTNGKGYSYILQSKGIGITATFTGNLVTDDITPALTNNGTGGAEYVGWNLLGNPFTSAIKWGQGSWNLTNVADEVHVWNNGSYINYTGGVGDLTDGIIPAQQGFFVKANGASPSLTIPADSRVHSTQSFYKNTISNVLRIDVSNDANDYTDAAFIRFVENATEGFDNGLDAHKLDNDALAPMIYTEANDVRLSINALPSVDENPEIPVSFTAGVNGQYTITASGMETFTNSNIFLIDLLTNARQNLSENSVYSYRATVTDNAARFKISFASVGVEENQLQNIGIYAANGFIVLQFPDETDALVSVVNIGGQVIFRKAIKGMGNIQLDAPATAGIYLITLTTDAGTTTRKVFVK